MKGTRFTQAMNQLNSAFEQAQQDEQQERTPLVANNEEVSSTKNNANFEEAKPLPEAVASQDVQKKNISQDLEKAIEKLQVRKQKKSLDSSELKQALPEVSQINNDSQNNEAEQRIKNLLEQVIQRKVDQRIVAILQKELAFSDSEQAVEQIFSSTKNIKKNRSQLEEKILQYSKIKFDFFVDLGQTKVKFKDLFSLQEGDVFSLNSFMDKNLIFFINQKPVGSGKIVNNRENKGFQIESFYQKI